MRSKALSPWLYFKIYVGGAGMAHLEHLLAEVVPRALGARGAAAWFFIRYADEEGVHLRLRIKARGDAAEAASCVEQVLWSGTRALGDVTTSSHRPVVSIPGASVLDPWLGKACSPRVERAEYEPEVETFGVRGITAAEELFQVSSNIAVRVVQLERARRIDRRTLSPALMAAVPEAFCPAVSRRDFWGAYAHYWVARHRERLAGYRFTELFAEKARKLLERGIPVVPPDDTFEPEARALLSRWRTGLQRAAAAFAARESALSGHALSFSFIHLMNNRLGAWFLEEVYFARLLAECAAGGKLGVDSTVR
jgi:thiopeptide-type bacteriocin biosynthesis protein